MNYSLFASIGNTPLIELSSFCENSCARLLGKQESRNPAGSVKCRVAAAMIETGEKSGAITAKTTIIEPTSGNTGIGLAYVCAKKQLRLILTMPESMSVERRTLLRYLGAELVLTPAAEGMSGAIQKAKDLHAEIPLSYIPDQFSNPANPAIHRATTAEEIWNDTCGEIDILVAGVGTGGTITGCAEVLKKKKPSVLAVAVEPMASPVLSGGKAGPHLIQGIGAGFVPEILNLSMLDQIMQVTNDQAIQAARELARREGILCGISSGAAAYAARLLATNPDNHGKTIVCILPDTGERYLSTALMEGYIN